MAAGQIESSLNIKKLYKTAFLGIESSALDRLRAWNGGKRFGY